MYCTCSVSLVFLHPDDACNHDSMLLCVDSELSSLNRFSIDVSERKSCRGFVFNTSFIIGYKFWFFFDSVFIVDFSFAEWSYYSIASFWYWVGLKFE